jgi:hypothetical protein
LKIVTGFKGQYACPINHGQHRSKTGQNQAPVHDLRVRGSVGVEITPRFFGAIAASLRRISMRFQF